MLDAETKELAQILWDYHKLNQPIKKADVIIVLGSHDTRAADRGAELYLQGYAPLVVCTGKSGRITTGLIEGWDPERSEAEIFSEIVVKKGVPTKKVLLEKEATNTQENILFTKKLLEQNGTLPQSVILVPKPYMERRSFATCKKQWPEVECMVTSADLTLDTYPFGDRTIEYMVHIMVGDTERIKLYGEKGFLEPQEIPGNVWVAYEKLVAKGYTDYLVKG